MGTAQEVLGNVSQLKGYVAERLVAQHLQSQGMEVEFPEASNQAGWDLLVNGQPYQVKCLANSAGVEEHLQRYPDVPVFINSELAGRYEGVDGVIPLPEISNDAVSKATSESLEASGEILDFEIPLIATTIASAKNVCAVIQSKTDIENAIKNVAFEAGGATAGGAAVSEALGLVGLALGPYGAVVGGLAGAVVGAHLGRRLANFARSKLMLGAEEAALETALRGLVRSAAAQVQTKTRIIEKKLAIATEHQATKRRGSSAVVAMFERRIVQEKRHCENVAMALRKIGGDVRSADTNARDISAATARVVVQVIGAGVPPFNVRTDLEKVANAVAVLREARARLLL
jgi:hypothetical protein